MATWGTFDFRIEEQADHTYPEVESNDQGPRMYRCKAVFDSLGVIKAMNAARNRATFFSSLGTGTWMAIIEAGSARNLTVPMSGQGPNGDTSDGDVFTSALLMKVSYRGAARITGKYRADLEFALPEVTG